MERGLQASRYGRASQFAYDALACFGVRGKAILRYIWWLIQALPDLKDEHCDVR